MSEQQHVTFQLPEKFGELIDTLQINGSTTGDGAVTFYANIYGSDEAGYIGIVESSHAEKSIAEAIKQGLIRPPIDWEHIRIHWASEHTGIAVFGTLEEARSKIGALRCDPPTWLPFR